MNHGDLAATVAVDTRMRAYLGDASARVLGFPVNYSAGIATRACTDDTLDAMLKRADGNLYAAKHQGRGRTLDADGCSVHDTITRSPGNYAAIAAAAG